MDSNERRRRPAAANSRPSLPHRTFLFFALISIAAAESEKSLYTDEDHVLQLNVSTFDSTVYNQPRAFFVEFYASWCGHCINYRPTFVKFATSLRDWSDIVQVTVVNCASVENSPLCREHSVAAFPTLKYFKHNSKSKDDAIPFVDQKDNLPEMTRSIVDWVVADANRDHPTEWPQLSITPASAQIAEMWAAAPADAQLLAVVVDNSPHSDGLGTIINYHRNRRVHVTVVDSAHPLTLRLGKSSLPGVHVYRRGGDPNPIFSSQGEMHFETIRAEIDRLLLSDAAAAAPANLQQQAPPPQQPAADSQTVAPKATWNQFEVQYLDLVSSLSYLIKQEVPRRSLIEGSFLKILKDWFRVLHLYLPLSAPIRRTLYRLDEYIQPLSTLKADDWLKKVDEIQNDLGHPLPTESNFRACRGSKPFLRGYTCGLWTMFHTVTVEAYKKNKHNPSFSPYAEVLEPLHQFIYNYLSCVECAKNFDKMARESLSPATVRQPEDTVLWLWRAHNRANKRLSGDATDDPQFPKQQFPARAICPQCRQSNGEFNEAAVLTFLERYYSDIKSDGVVPQPEYNVKEFGDGKLKGVADKRLPVNPKFFASVDKMEEAEARLKAERARWGNGEAPRYNGDSVSADRTTFSFIWLVIVAGALFAIYYKYRQNRSKFWKTFYYYNDYKFLPWKQNDNVMKYAV